MTCDIVVWQLEVCSVSRHKLHSGKKLQCYGVLLKDCFGISLATLMAPPNNKKQNFTKRLNHISNFFNLFCITVAQYIIVDSCNIFCSINAAHRHALNWQSVNVCGFLLYYWKSVISFFATIKLSIFIQGETRSINILMFTFKWELLFTSRAVLLLIRQDQIWWPMTLKVYLDSS